MKYVCKESGVCPKDKDICCYTCNDYGTCRDKCILPSGEEFIKCAVQVPVEPLKLKAIEIIQSNINFIEQRNTRSNDLYCETAAVRQAPLDYYRLGVISEEEYEEWENKTNEAYKNKLEELCQKEQGNA